MRVTASGVEGVIAELDALAERTANLAPVLEVAARDTQTLIDDSFRKSRSPDGTMWAPLAPSTIAKRRARYGARRTRVIKTLVNTGILRNSIYSTDAQTSLLFGTNIEYAPYHQFGSGRMHRPFLPVDKSGAGYVLMTGGAAGRHWRDVRRMVIEYIRTGRITE